MLRVTFTMGETMNFKQITNQPIFRKWWFWVATIGLLVVIGVGGGKGTRSTSMTNDSLAIAKIDSTHDLYTRESFSFIANDGIYGLSSVWSTGGEVGTSLYKAMQDKTPVAFKGTLGRYLPEIEYRFEYTNPNVGCTKNHWVEVDMSLTDQQAKELGWKYSTDNTKEFIATGVVKAINVKPAQTSCDNGKVEIKLSLDKVYEVSTNKCVLQ